MIIVEGLQSNIKKLLIWYYVNSPNLLPQLKGVGKSSGAVVDTGFVSRVIED
jgi:hypothetical protein